MWQIYYTIYRSKLKHEIQDKEVDKIIEMCIIKLILKPMILGTITAKHENYNGKHSLCVESHLQYSSLTHSNRIDMFHWDLTGLYVYTCWGELQDFLVDMHWSLPANYSRCGFPPPWFPFSQIQNCETASDLPLRSESFYFDRVSFALVKCEHSCHFFSTTYQLKLNSTWDMDMQQD